MQETYSPYMKMYIDYIENPKSFDMPYHHYHDTYELYIQVSGQRYSFLEGHSYMLKPNDMFLIKPFELHYNQSKDFNSYSRYVINFSLDQLRGILSSSEISMLQGRLNTSLLHLDDKTMIEACRLTERIKYYNEKTAFLSEKVANTSLMQLLVLVAEYKRQHPDAVDSQDIDLIDSSLDETVISAIQYIHKNYMEDLNLEDITSNVHLSKFHFSRLFAEQTGVTIMKYLNNYRMKKVHALLIETDMKIHDIAITTGFSSTAHMSRVFKQTFGESPRDFKARK